ncbi:hypothetical protein BH11MYX4_BH11MYX4_12340 [soil metagenome]
MVTYRNGTTGRPEEPPPVVFKAHGPRQRSDGLINAAPAWAVASLSFLRQ